MTILYNCRHAGDQYRITKFDSDMNVESSYLCTPSECDCPAGVRPTCRHREMLPRFLHRGHIGDEWFYDYDRGGWVQQGPEWAQPQENITQTALESSMPEGLPPEADPFDSLPTGVDMIPLDCPEGLHNAIADAIGEPEAKLPLPAAVAQLAEQTSVSRTDYEGSNPSSGSIPSVMKRRFL